LRRPSFFHCAPAISTRKGQPVQNQLAEASWHFPCLEHHHVTMCIHAKDI